MAHLGTSYSSYTTFLNQADGYWAVDLAALNSSGVTGNAILATNTENDGTRYLNVSIFAEGLTPDQTHAQHVHGLFDDNGDPVDSVTPGLAQDSDGDGIVEVLEGVPSYGDVLLPLVSPEGGEMPMTDFNGQLSFIQSYDLGDDSNFFSPVTGADYTGDDILPLALREIVLHGMEVPGNIGIDGPGIDEVDGNQEGYVGILPAAAGEIEQIDRAQALDMLEDQIAGASDSFVFGAGDDTFDAGAGNDTLRGGAGNDTLSGGGDGDRLFGDNGNDVLSGGEGNDLVVGGAGDDRLMGDAGADQLIGQSGNDQLSGGALADMLLGGDGDDFLNGGFGFDRMTGGDGADRFFHAGVAGHGTDWVQDFDDEDADLLVWGGGTATQDRFQVNYAQTEGAGDDTAEAFVIDSSSGQILWALVDGADEAIRVQAGGQVFEIA
ncbi:calcium-binding protein [Pseudoroseicyclus aestuarii]|uniref:Hemolysin type calcium-binding protein n=1 Tax=Pseudoroseicyclus aestuarii TaxID=1795041 RepID=A0A318SSS7_9RHOB|nr:calcium-binding protein [Pseudoroseicyclus aestuarii]PYE82189.1 hemolysin type calcium-binding protein [Pseudoroseicyclus aestuarii]